MTAFAPELAITVSTSEARCPSMRKILGGLVVALALLAGSTAAQVTRLPLSSLTPRGAVAATDIMPILPSGGTTLESAVLSDLKTYFNANLAQTVCPGSSDQNCIIGASAVQGYVPGVTPLGQLTFTTDVGPLAGQFTLAGYAGTHFGARNGQTDNGRSNTCTGAYGQSGLPIAGYMLTGIENSCAGEAPQIFICCKANANGAWSYNASFYLLDGQANNTSGVNSGENNVHDSFTTMSGDSSCRYCLGGAQSTVTGAAAAYGTTHSYVLSAATPHDSAVFTVPSLTGSDGYTITVGDMLDFTATGYNIQTINSITANTSITLSNNLTKNVVAASGGLQKGGTGTIYYPILAVASGQAKWQFQDLDWLPQPHGYIDVSHGGNPGSGYTHYGASLANVPLVPITATCSVNPQAQILVGLAGTANAGKVTSVNIADTGRCTVLGTFGVDAAYEPGGTGFVYNMDQFGTGQSVTGSNGDNTVVGNVAELVVTSPQANMLAWVGYQPAGSVTLGHTYTGKIDNGSGGAGTTLTVISGLATGENLATGETVTGTGVSGGTAITGNIAGSGNGSTWAVNNSQLATSTTLTSPANVVTPVTAGSTICDSRVGNCYPLSGGTAGSNVVTLTYTGSMAGPIAESAPVAVMSGGTVASVTVSGNGKYYLTPPTVVFTGGSPSVAATGTAVLTNGVLTSISTTGGSGYGGTPTISLTGGTLIGDIAYLRQADGTPTSLDGVTVIATNPAAGSFTASQPQTFGTVGSPAGFGMVDIPNPFTGKVVADGFNSCRAIQGPSTHVTCIGQGNLQSITTGDFLTSIGSGTLGNLTTGQVGVALGDNVGVTCVNAQHFILIGHGVDCTSAGSNGDLNIGGVITGSGIQNPGTSAITIVGNLFVGPPTGTNTDFLCMAGTGEVLIQASACTISSRRFKDEIRPFKSDALRLVDRLPVITFKLKNGRANPDPNGAAEQIGLLAEDVARVAPKCAIYENDMKTPKSYRQECVIALLVKGEQELVTQNMALQARLDRLEARESP